MRTLEIDGRAVPVLGQGTWHMGDSKAKREEEIATLQRGIECQMTLIDTAEMYGDGRSEKLVGETIAGLRDRVYLVSKVLPTNASPEGVIRACEASLKRLGVEALDLYLLHWRGRHPLQETVKAFDRLIEGEKVRAWGVSNFAVEDMEELFDVPGGEACAVNQVLYNPEHRGIEYDLLPWCNQRNVRVMAYSPLGQGEKLLRSAALREVAKKRGVSVAQAALAWCLRQPVIAIPKTSSVKHVEENAAAADLKLDAEDLAAIDRAYPAPRRKQPLAML
ncbi:MAG TPA: aldo/keto reductase [Sphingomicrobium sp.]|nr:aldo/keto reductase [Sphingomicrobium sp.]